MWLKHVVHGVHSPRLWLQSMHDGAQTSVLFCEDLGLTVD
jgi:hypothetical protein